MFSAMPKAKCKKGVAARPAIVRRSARSVRAHARLTEEGPHIAPDEESLGDNGGLHRQIAELQAQLRRATVRPDAATASTSALDAHVTELPSMFTALVPVAHSPVDLTPLLPPAPTMSQDLLANIFHHIMTTPTTAGEHDGSAEGGIAQLFVLGAKLDPHPCHGARAAVATDQLGRGDGRYPQFPRRSPGGAASTSTLSPRGAAIIHACHTGRRVLRFQPRGTCARTPCRFRHACITCGQGHPSRR